MIYKHGVVSAFCRVFYNPDVSSAYAFVLGTYLVIPVGMVLGYRNAPYLFYLLSKMISFACPFFHRLPRSCPTPSMINRFSFPHTLPSSRDINPDHKDPMDQLVHGTKLVPHLTFVYDMIMVEVRYLISQAANNSILTASVFVGNSDLVEEPISIKKIERFLTHLNKKLGFITNSR